MLEFSKQQAWNLLRRLQSRRRSFGHWSAGTGQWRIWTAVGRTDIARTQSLPWTQRPDTDHRPCSSITRDVRNTD